MTNDVNLNVNESNQKMTAENRNKEKTKCLMRKIIWAIITFLFFFTPIIIEETKPKLEVVSCDVYTDYYSSINETSVDIYLTFNREVYSGYATFNFYNSSGNLLETTNEYFHASNELVASNLFTSVDGKVEYYELVSYEFDLGTPYWVRVCYASSLFSIIIFISALLISYKEYDFNGKKISVYAGWYHHTLRINGELCDEHNTIVFYTAIHLSTEQEGNLIEATISLANRISVKVNNKLIKSIKQNQKNKNLKT